MLRMFSRSNRAYRQHVVSTDNLVNTIDMPCGTSSLTRNGKTEYEITSVKILQLIEKKKYQRVVELLRELPSAHLLACLQNGFPFKALNKSVPETFPIWETLLTKVHNNEEGYVREFPYSACDALALKIAYLLSHLEHQHSLLQPSSANHSTTDHNQQLFQQCRRLLKKVFMQYPDIVKNLMRENERVSKALYSMQLHIPLGLDPSIAVSLQQSILKEVTCSLSDFEESKERLEELSVENSHIRVELIAPSDRSKNRAHISIRSLTQIQVQQRLYSNQCVLGAVKPIKREDSLPQLTEMLNSRVIGDKDVLAIFSNLRDQFPKITDHEPIEPWLRKYQHSVECAITLLKEIETELIIKSPNVSPSTDHELYPAKPPSITASPPPPSLVTQSMASLDRHNCNSDDDNGLFMTPFNKRYSSTDKLHLDRPTSAVSLDKTTKLSQSAQSLTSELEVSSSVQDIPSNVKSHSQTMAGMKKKPSGSLRRSLRHSLRRLSSSAGNVSPKKKMHRTGSGGEIVLEEARKDLLEAQETIHSLRKRERELTDRLSEQAQRHLLDSDMFEDILMGASRPTLVIQRYQELYSQERVEAYDAISDTELLDNEDILPEELLLDIMKMAYLAAQCNLESLHNQWKRSLCCQAEEQTTPAFKQLEIAVSSYIRKMAPTYNPKDILSMVKWDLEKKYCSLTCFNAIMRLESLQAYIHEAAKLTWDLVVQTPPMILNYKEVEFVAELHTRFHTADRASDLIIMYQWPTLIQESSGTVLYKGVVVT